MSYLLLYSPRATDTSYRSIRHDSLNFEVSGERHADVEVAPGPVDEVAVEAPLATVYPFPKKSSAVKHSSARKEVQHVN